MARILVNPRIGVRAQPFTGSRPYTAGHVEDATHSTKAHARDMRDIYGVYDQMVYDTVLKKYLPATRADLSG